MRIALAIGFLLGVSSAALAQTAVTVPAAPAVAPAMQAQPADAALPAAAPSVAASVLSADDVALYRKAFSSARSGELTAARAMVAKAADPSLAGYIDAAYILAHRPGRDALVKWLTNYRELSVADRVYRLAVGRSTKKVRRGKKLVSVAVVTNIPAPVPVGRRTGGYEDAEQPEPTPDSDAARAVMRLVAADIKAGHPEKAQARLETLQSAGTAPSDDIVILSHRIAASYLAEGMNEEAFKLTAGLPSGSVPQVDWDAGFAAYRLGRYDQAIAHLEELAVNGGAQAQLRAQAAFWAARAHMQMGEPQKVIGLLSAAAKEKPTFYGLIAERALGMDTGAGFSDAVLSESDFAALMTAPSAHRAVALHQVGENEFAGPELNRAFVDNDEKLDPAMAALAREIGVTNVELRASEKSVAQGLLLKGLFPVPPYAPEGGYHVDSSLVLAFARIESRFQQGAISPVGARGIMQIMPATARHLGGKKAAEQLYDPSYALSLGQRYIAELLDGLNGNLLELGGAYNAGPGAVNRWLNTKAGKDDPLLFVESIPVAETRAYVKHVMEYHWMYRRRMGQEAKSLDETARGEWPRYRPALPAAPVIAKPQPAYDPVFADVNYSQASDNPAGNMQSVQ